MRSIVKDLRPAVLTGTLLVLPFLILESIHTTLTRQNAPGLILLFAVLWLLPTVFFVVLRARNGNAMLRVAALLVLAVLWGSVLIDQMPCFLGIPNCD